VGKAENTRRAVGGRAVDSNRPPCRMLTAAEPANGEKRDPPMLVDVNQEARMVGVRYLDPLSLGCLFLRQCLERAVADRLCIPKYEALCHDLPRSVQHLCNTPTHRLLVCATIVQHLRRNTRCTKATIRYGRKSRS